MFRTYINLLTSVSLVRPQNPHNYWLFVALRSKIPVNTEMGSNQHFFDFWKELRKERKEQKNIGNTQNRLNRQYNFERCIAMQKYEIEWDKIPDVINKDQFYRICHISKSTALHLLQSGKVPCEYSGKRTRCYKIKKEDVKKYLEERAIYPELYTAPKGWYGVGDSRQPDIEMNDELLEAMHKYYTKLLRKYKDVVTSKEIVEITGYSKSTVNRWCSTGVLKSFIKGQIYCIPKVFLVDFFCSFYFRSLVRKSLWHIQTLNDFQRKYCLKE